MFHCLLFFLRSIPSLIPKLLLCKRQSLALLHEFSALQVSKLRLWDTVKVFDQFLLFSVALEVLCLPSLVCRLSIPFFFLFLISSSSYCHFSVLRFVTHETWIFSMSFQNTLLHWRNKIHDHTQNTHTPFLYRGFCSRNTVVNVLLPFCTKRTKELTWDREAELTKGNRTEQRTYKTHSMCTVIFTQTKEKTQGSQYTYFCSKILCLNREVNPIKYLKIKNKDSDINWLIHLTWGSSSTWRSFLSSQNKALDRKSSKIDMKLIKSS